VGGVESVGNLDTHFQQLFQLERPALDLVSESRAVQILHGDEGLPLLLADVVDRANVGMVQGRSRLGLALEAGQGLGVAGNVIRQELERDKAVQPGVFGFVDDAHATTTDLLHNAVVRDGPADHWRTMLLVVKPASQRNHEFGGAALILSIIVWPRRFGRKLKAAC